MPLLARCCVDPKPGATVRLVTVLLWTSLARLELETSLVFIRLSISSLYWLSCLVRLFWMGRVVERLGTLQSLEEEEEEGESSPSDIIT